VIIKDLQKRATIVGPPDIRDRILDIFGMYREGVPGQRRDEYPDTEADYVARSGRWSFLGRCMLVVRLRTS